jgi:hypothetical protein
MIGIVRKILNCSRMSRKLGRSGPKLLRFSEIALNILSKIGINS